MKFVFVLICLSINLVQIYASPAGDLTNLRRNIPHQKKDVYFPHELGGEHTEHQHHHYDHHGHNDHHKHDEHHEHDSHHGHHEHHLNYDEHHHQSHGGHHEHHHEDKYHLSEHPHDHHEYHHGSHIHSHHKLSNSRKKRETDNQPNPDDDHVVNQPFGQDGSGIFPTAGFSHEKRILGHDGHGIFHVTPVPSSPDGSEPSVEGIFGRTIVPPFVDPDLVRPHHLLGHDGHGIRHTSTTPAPSTVDDDSPMVESILGLGHTLVPLHV